MRIRAARPVDVRAIHALIETFVPQGILLPRSIEAIERDLKNFFVAIEPSKLAGCVSLDPYKSSGLAEIRSLAVAAEFQGNGLGARLVAAAVKKARRLRIARVIAVTHSLAFFQKQGFVPTALSDLPEKIARDCCRCPRHGWCGQQGAMMLLQPVRAAEYRLSKFENRKSVQLPATAAS